MTIVCGDSHTSTHGAFGEQLTGALEGETGKFHGSLRGTELGLLCSRVLLHQQLPGGQNHGQDRVQERGRQASYNFV